MNQQDWYRMYESQGMPTNHTGISISPDMTTEDIQNAMQRNAEWRRELNRWQDALRYELKRRTRAANGGKECSIPIRGETE